MMPTITTRKRRIDLHVPADVGILVDALPPDVSRSALFAGAVREFAAKRSTCPHKRAVCDACGARLPTSKVTLPTSAASPVT